MNVPVSAEEPYHAKDAKTSKELPGSAIFASVRSYEQAIEELRTAWLRRGKEENVSTDAGDLEDHGVSAWSYHGEKKPCVVVWVES